MMWEVEILNQLRNYGCCVEFSGGKRENAFFSPCYHRPSIFHPFKTYILCMFSFLHTFYVNLKWVSNEKTRRVSDEASSQCNILPTQDLVSLPSASSLKTFSFFFFFREYFSSRDDLDKLYASQEKTLTEWARRDEKHQPLVERQMLLRSKTFSI